MKTVTRVLHLCGGYSRILKTTVYSVFINYSIGAIWAIDDFEHRERHMSLHIRNICRDLCNAAELYYQNHKDEFDFIKYKIARINPEAEHLWEYSKTVTW